MVQVVESIVTMSMVSREKSHFEKFFPLWDVFFSFLHAA